MTRSERIDKLASRFQSLAHNDAEQSVALMAGAIIETLARGERVEIRGFGSFGTVHRPSRIGRNPKTGEQVEVPAKTRPHFKAGKEMRERVDL